MPITPRPNKTTKDIRKIEDNFIDSAPDGVSTEDNELAKPKRVRKGKKIQISLTITESVLEQVDEAAKNLGLSRAAVINIAISQSLQQGIKLDL